MLHMLNQQHPGAAAGLLTTTNEAFDRVAMHAVRRELLNAQAEAAGLPLHVLPLPWPCSNEQYEAIMRTAVAGFVRDGFTHVAFGDLFLEDVRRYRETRLAGSGLEPLFPDLENQTDHRSRARHDRGWPAGAAYVRQSRKHSIAASPDARSISRCCTICRPASIHAARMASSTTFAFAGPMFNHPIAIRLGEIIDRDGFVFADVELGSDPEFQHSPQLGSRPNRDKC